MVANSILQGYAPLWQEVVKGRGASLTVFLSLITYMQRMEREDRLVLTSYSTRVLAPAEISFTVPLRSLTCKHTNKRTKSI